MNKEFIKNETDTIYQDFEKCFYYLIAGVSFLRELIIELNLTAKKTFDPVKIKRASQLSISVQALMFSLEQFENRHKVENPKEKEIIKAALKERIQIFAITLSRLPFEQHADLIAMLQDFYQGQYKIVDESMLDAILDYEKQESLEGMAFIKSINPNLSVEEIEIKAKELVQWSDFRNMKLSLKQS